MQIHHNARFWVFHRTGYVKLTLKPGQALSHGFCEATDEGWSASGSSFRHCGDHIIATHDDSGVDCDGRMDRTVELRASIDRLADHLNCEGVPVPLWDVLDVSQRDHSAEAMNY